MTDIEEKRAFVAGMYDGPRWKRRVKQMTDAQVVAIFIREQDKKGKPKHEGHGHKESQDDGEAPF
jgi:hypothetical protein